MNGATALPSYVVVTPVRDEARHVGATVASMRAQTHLPQRWVIVDDGSTDDTPRILEAATRELPWVRTVSTASRQRNLGCAEVLAFRHGLASVGGEVPWDFVVKLDADLRLPPDYFERLLARMASDARWGIASGVYCEMRRGRWIVVPMPRYHAAGASKVVRRECFEQIGGFVASRGWDTVDEIRAGVRGWRTGHFDDLCFEHLKPEGAAMGRLGTHRFHGDIYYQCGGGAGFLLTKAAHRMVTAWPPVVGGLALLWGYLEPQAARRPRLVNDEEARYYRTLLNARLGSPMARLCGRARA